MRNKKFKFWRTTLFALLVIATGCEREISDDIEIAEYSSTGEIFTDNFVGMGSNFYFPYSDGFAKPAIFEVDTRERYEGSASLRIDVPNSNDPEGVYVGAFFRVDGAGRDLSRYDALTFWVKSTIAPTIESFGFGQSEYTTFQTSLSNTQLSTTWTKIIIPIPDPSKLTNERGMFWLVATPDEGDGYSFWIDELKFEKLGTLGQPRPSILGGQDQTAQANVDSSVPLISFTQTFNKANGQDVTVNVSPKYFNFETSNPFVASVDVNGLITVDGPGEIDPNTGLIDNTAIITAYLGGVEAAGSLTIEAVDINIISIFSDVFANVAVDNFNGFYLGDGQTTAGGVVVENGNNIVDYTALNFVAIEFYGRDGSNVQPIDATEMINMHIDIRVNETISPTDALTIEVFNNFATSNQIAGNYTVSGSDLQSNTWVEFDIPLSSFIGLSSRDALGAIIFSSANINNVSFDNIYFYAAN